jgi:murein DD-endopeptidase MepM/ murein hydrolase activator NlpD
MRRWLVLVPLLLLAAGAWVAAGRAAPPTLAIVKPDRTVGQKSEIVVTASAPGARFETLTIAVEQNGRSIPLFSLESPAAASVTPAGEDSVRIARPFGKASVPDLQAGVARILVGASRRSRLGLRVVSSETSRDVTIRLDPPRVSAASTHHYVNHGGAEMVVYRVTPPDVVSGVRVGTTEFRGFPAAGTALGSADASLAVAFFPLAYDQDLNVPIALFARDEAGNEATAAFVDRVFEKPFRRSRIELDDRFLQRVVPEILARAPELKASTPTEDLLASFLRINGDLRRQNAERIAAIVAGSAPTRLWQGPFVQLGSTKVEAGFADHRTYTYGGKEVDRQVHLGFDLASTMRTPVVAANAGTVLYADWLGIYGNCVIVDHGLGVSSLYGHLSAVEVKSGDTVAKGRPLGRSGLTGLAGGDHLHFTMLVHGQPVNPVEWWDPHWVEDRIDRKLR